MADLQQSSFANVQMPVTNPGLTLGALRPPDVQGLLQTVPIAALLQNGLASGIAAGSDIAKMPTAGNQLQLQNQQIATQRMMQDQGQNYLAQNGQNNAGLASTFGPEGQITRSPVGINPWTYAAGQTGLNLGQGGGSSANPPSAPTGQAGQTAQNQAGPPPPPDPHVPPYPPADVMGWYKANKGTNVKDVEWNPTSQRYDAFLKDGSVQPVPPSFIQTHAGNWRPKALDQDMAAGNTGGPSAQVGGMPATPGGNMLPPNTMPPSGTSSNAINTAVDSALAQNAKQVADQNSAQNGVQPASNQPPNAPSVPQQAAASQNGAQPFDSATAKRPEGTARSSADCCIYGIWSCGSHGP